MLGSNGKVRHHNPHRRCRELQRRVRLVAKQHSIALAVRGILAMCAWWGYDQVRTRARLSKSKPLKHRMSGRAEQCLVQLAGDP